MVQYQRITAFQLLLMYILQRPLVIRVYQHPIPSSTPSSPCPPPSTAPAPQCGPWAAGWQRTRGWTGSPGSGGGHSEGACYHKFLHFLSIKNNNNKTLCNLKTPHDRKLNCPTILMVISVFQLLIFLLCNFSLLVSSKVSTWSSVSSSSSSRRQMPIQRAPCSLNMAANSSENLQRGRSRSKSRSRHLQELEQEQGHGKGKGHEHMQEPEFEQGQGMKQKQDQMYDHTCIRCLPSLLIQFLCTVCTASCRM